MQEPIAVKWITCSTWTYLKITAFIVCVGRSKNSYFPVVQVRLVHQCDPEALDGLFLETLHFQHEGFLRAGHMCGSVLCHHCTTEPDDEITCPESKPKTLMWQPRKHVLCLQEEPETTEQAKKPDQLRLCGGYTTALFFPPPPHHHHKYEHRSRLKSNY